MQGPNHKLNAYRVKVGHAEVIVRAEDRGQAIVLARRKLSAEMPRFYDVIRALEDARFEVREAA